MKIFEYYASLRSEILEVVTGVENSGWSLFWDDTTPNYVTKRKLEELYRKLKNARKKYMEEVVSKIMKKKEIIIAEKLKVKEMLCKDNNPKSIRKNISNVMFQKILQTLEYKCKWSGKIFHQISTYYPSSQICSECGYKDSAMKDYGIRKYECPVCGIQLERDYNASRNILEEGLRELSLV